MQLHLSLIAHHRDSGVILLASGGAGMEVLQIWGMMHLCMLQCTEHFAPNTTAVNNKLLFRHHGEILQATIYTGLNAEAWKLKLLGDWAVMSEAWVPKVSDSDPADKFRQLELVNLNCKTTGAEARMYYDSMTPGSTCAIVTLDEGWRRHRARQLGLMTASNHCKICTVDLTKEPDLHSHYLSCAPKCSGCGKIDHRVGQMICCRCIHHGRKTVLHFEDAFFVLDGRCMDLCQDGVGHGVGYGLLFSKGMCSWCLMHQGISSKKVYSRSSSVIAITDTTGGVTDLIRSNIGTMITVGRHSINFGTTDHHCDRCGVAGSVARPLSLCGRCKKVQYCSKECQKSSWP